MDKKSLEKGMELQDKIDNLLSEINVIHNGSMGATIIVRGYESTPITISLGIIRSEVKKYLEEELELCRKEFEEL